MKDKKESLLEKAAKVFTEPTKELNIPLDELQPFRNHPYKVRDDEEMEMLTQSIKENGVLTPIIVTYMDVRKTKYDIISGHRRYLACKKLGLETIPAVFKEFTYEEAVIAMVESNLQREHILPSEKAKAYKMKMDAMKQQGRRTDLTSVQIGPKLTAEDISTEDSPSQVKRYIRLTKLIPELLDKVDEGKIALTPAVELSYLRADEQKNLLETMNSEDCTPSLSQAQQLRNLSLAELLTMDQIFAVMSKSKANQKEKITIKLDDIRKFIPKDYTQKQVGELLIALLEKWSKQQNKTRSDKGAR